MGSIYKRGNVFWIKYYRDGVAYRESSDSTKEGDAKNLLRRREGAIAEGVPVTPTMNRCTIDDLWKDLLNDYNTNGRRSVKDVERHFTLHLEPFFGGRKAISVTPVDVRQYIAKRQAEGAKNATINRELSALKRTYSLAVDAGKLTHRPKIPMLKEDNVRKGFFERRQFERVRSCMIERNRPLVTFLYISGCRVGEAMKLQWRQIDFEAGTIRLDPGTTKSDDGRVFVMTVELRSALEAQQRYTDSVQRKRDCIVPHVFHRDGKAIKGFRRSWATACKKAGVPGMLRHDFRRTAVRNLVRAGVPEAVAMKMTGHKTRSVFERYNIVSEEDLADAARKLDAFAGTITGTTNT